MPILTSFTEFLYDYVIMGLLIWSFNFSPQRQPMGGKGKFVQANLQKLECQGGHWSFE